LGVGLDSDGHKRVTKGDNFALVGGSKDTHEQMTEKAIKINEKLKARGKQLHEVSRQEFDDIAHEVGLKRTRFQEELKRHLPHIQAVINPLRFQRRRGQLIETRS
jgi:hypothetical protein